MDRPSKRRPARKPARPGCEPSDATPIVTTERDLSRNNRLLNLLNRLNVRTLEQTKLERVVDETLRDVVALLEVRGGGVYLTDETDRTLELKAACGLPKEFVKQVSAFPIDTPQIRRLHALSRPLSLDELFQSSSRMLHRIRRFGLRHVLATPIEFKGRLLGVLNLAADREFLEDEREIAAAVCNQLGLALANLRLIAELQEADQKYVTAAENAMDGIMIAQDERFLFVNPSLANMLKYTRDELLSLPIERMMAPLSRPEIMRKYRARLQGRRPTDRYETQFLRRDGSLVDVEIHARTIKMGGRRAALSVIRDITRRKRDEQRVERAARFQKALLLLAKSAPSNLEEAFRRLTRTASATLEVDRVGIWLFEDGQNSIVLQDMYLASADEHQRGLRISSQAAPRYFRALRRNRAISAPDARADVRTCEFNEGYLIPNDIHSLLDIPIHFEGRLVGVVCHEHVGWKREWSFEEQGFAASIADMAGLVLGAHVQRKAQQALRESERRFRNLFENAVIGIYRTTPDGRILMANPTLVRMLGFSSFAQLKQRNIEETGFDMQESRRRFKQAIETEGQVIGLESTWVKKDGGVLHIRENARAVRDAEGDALYYEGTVEDITEQKKLQDQILEGKWEAELFNDIVSHDINNFAQIIVNNVQALKQGLFGELSELQSDRMCRIERQTGRIVELSGQMREFLYVRHVLQQIKPVDLRDVLNNVVRHGRELFPNASIIFRSPGKRVVMANELLDIMFINLIKNSLTHNSSPEPRVELSIRRGADQRRRQWQVVVEDNGVGISDALKGRLFQRFERGGKRSGMGLGLFIVKELLDQCGGTVAFENIPGPAGPAGARFVISLPARRGKP